MDALLYITIFIFIFVALLLILMILIQKGRGGGLSSAFGGGGGGGTTAFGTKTGDVLTWATSIVFGIFILLAIALNLLSNRRAEITGDATPVFPGDVSTELQPGDAAAPATLPEPSTSGSETPVVPEAPASTGDEAPAPVAAEPTP